MVAGDAFRVSPDNYRRRARIRFPSELNAGNAGGPLHAPLRGMALAVPGGDGNLLHGGSINGGSEK